MGLTAVFITGALIAAFVLLIIVVVFGGDHDDF